MKKNFLLLIILGLVLILTIFGLTGCSSITGAQSVSPQAEIIRQPNTDKPVDGLDGSQWKLISLDGNKLVSGSYISLYFRKGTIWGCAGINIYGANYSVEDPDTLTFSDGMITLIGGPENIMQQEQAYIKYFQGAVSYRLKDNHLEISNTANPKPLVFERLPEYPMNPSDLVGTKWQLVSLNDEAVMEGLSITLSFDSDSRASGQAGCFAYELPYGTKAYKPSGDDIRWGSICRRTGELSPELEKQAGHYTSSVGWAANYLLTKDKLEIFTAKGDTLVYKPLTGVSK